MLYLAHKSGDLILLRGSMQSKARDVCSRYQRGLCKSLSINNFGTSWSRVPEPERRNDTLTIAPKYYHRDKNWGMEMMRGLKYIPNITYLYIITYIDRVRLKPYINFKLIALSRERIENHLYMLTLESRCLSVLG